MNKKWVWYVCAVLLCCGSLAFVSIAKQSDNNSNANLLKSLAKQKASLIQNGQAADYAAKLKALNGQGSVADPALLGQRAPQGYAPAPQANQSVATPLADDYKATYEQLKSMIEEGVQLTPDQKDVYNELFETYFAPRNGADQLDETGGPDGFGYLYVDNQAPDTATFAWEEADASWTTITAFNAGSFTEDDAAAQITWGSAFSFYGTNYTSAYVSTNGLIHFPSANTAYSNQCTWAGSGPAAAIFPLWDDNHVGTGGPGVSDSGRVVWKDFGDRVVVTWDSIGICCSLGSALREFQAVLYPATGKVKLQYRTMTGTVPTATIGIQAGNLLASNRLTYRCNTADQNLLPGRAVWFYQSTATTGRCCYGDVCAPTCVDGVSALDCAALSGTFTLDGVCPCPVPAAGDLVCNAIPVPSLPFTADGSTCGLANDYDETCPFGGSTSPDVVYEYSPASNITVDISLCQGTTNYDTKIFVYENTVTPGAPFACNDDACTAPLFANAWVSTLLGLNLTGGNTYYIVVDGYGGGCGNYTLSIEGAVPCIVDCGAFDIVEPAESDSCGRENSDPNGGCNQPVPAYTSIACGDTFCGETFTYDSCGNTALAYRDTDWLRLTLTEQTDLTITGIAEFANMIIFLTNTDCNALTVYGQTSGSSLPCDVVTLTVTCLAPGDYYVVPLINSFGSTGGAPFASHLKYRVWTDCATAACQPPVNDDCANAIDLGVVPSNGSVNALVSNEFAGNSCSDVCDLSSTGPDQFFKFTLESCRLIAITADPNDPHISVYNNGDCCGTAILCNDDWGNFDITGLEGWLNPSIYPVSFIGSMVADSLPAGTYYIRAGEWSSGWNGDYTLTVYDFGPCVPEPCDPIVDLAITVESVANLPNNYKLWWTAPQTDDYKVWSTTDPQNDGNPDDGSDLDFVLEATLLGLAAGPQTWTAPAGFVTYKNFVVTTVCEPYTEPTGRCCYDNNTQCANVTAAECDGLGGVWGGSFVTCESAACPPPLPTGRCCYNGGVDCATNFETECATLGGSWIEGIDCTTACGLAPANDDCASPIALTLATPTPGTNVDATGTDISLLCAFNDSLDVWYSVTVPTTNLVTVTLCDAGTNFDTTLDIWDACGGTELACNDDATCTFSSLYSTVTFTPAAAGTYLIRVAGYNGSSGSFVITATQ